MRNNVFLWLFVIILGVSCADQGKKSPNVEAGNEVLVNSIKNLTKAQVDRHFTPPVASRNYAYPNIAGYEAIQPFYDEYISLTGQLNGFNELPQPDLSKEYDLNLVWITSFNQTAFKLVYSDTIVSYFMEQQTAELRKNIDDDVADRSIEYGMAVAEAVLKWADEDGYRETRNMPEFKPDERNEYWKPTSPDYMAAIEPYWNKIRPFVMDSAAQFKPIPPTAFDTSTGSLFMADLQGVKLAVDTANDEQVAIAKFWDCNPNISHHHGHMMYFFQKISPGGHWIHIGLQAVQAENLPLIEASSRMTMLSITIADAFIACWDEKYRSNYIRPETVIKNKISKEWDPILQTPAFPEYPSGHSLASASAATILTHMYGNGFEFQDSSEKEYGLPVREFGSFREASDEAAISRLYGGIHYMPAITEGITMGNKVGDMVFKRVKYKTQE